MLKKPLYELSRFIEDNLEPNRLEDFVLENIKTLRDDLE